MEIKEFYHPSTSTLAFIVYDETKKAIIIDPVLDYDPKASMIGYHTPKEYLKFLNDHDLELTHIFETHAHADHLSSSQFLKEKYPNAMVAISEHITKVQELFKGFFNFENKSTDGNDFDLLLKEGQCITVGKMNIEVIETPGHTPACLSFLFNKTHVFSGDALFIEDFGTGRCDFPAGSAQDLYNSVMNKLYVLDDDVKVYVGHDYRPGGRALRWETTIGKSKQENIQLKGHSSEKEFVGLREDRDSRLDAPALLLQSVQFNAWAGKMPDPEGNGVAYFKLPVRSE